jgi:hypothetical protein
MSVGKCLGCGELTNSCTSDWWLTPDRKPHKCYVRWINNKPEKGCGYNDGSKFDREFADKIISSKESK